MKKNIVTVKHSTIYKKFSDGESFVPDIGRGSSLGEIFTPKIIVDKMIRSLGINKAISTATVFEPASGHGNFGIEILKCKIESVLSEMVQDNVDKENWTKEYEIRSMLALGSIYMNDIDSQNIGVLKNRFSRYISKLYKNYAENSKGEIPEYYDRAIACILGNNCILADFIGHKNRDIKFCLYYRDGDEIYRVVRDIGSVFKNHQQKQPTLFDEEEIGLPFITADKIRYDAWELSVCETYNITNYQPKISNYGKR